MVGQGGLSKRAAWKLGALHKGRPLLLAMAREQLEDPAAAKRLVSLLGENLLRWAKYWRRHRC